MGRSWGYMMEICLTKLQPSLGILGKSFPIRHTPCSATPYIRIKLVIYMSNYTPLDHTISYHIISISPFISYKCRSYEDNKKSSRTGSRYGRSKALVAKLVSAFRLLGSWSTTKPGAGHISKRIENHGKTMGKP
jgi:hypothetical protein